MPRALDKAVEAYHRQLAAGKPPEDAVAFFREQLLQFIQNRAARPVIKERPLPPTLQPRRQPTPEPPPPPPKPKPRPRASPSSGQRPPIWERAAAKPSPPPPEPEPPPEPPRSSARKSGPDVKPRYMEIKEDPNTPKRLLARPLPPKPAHAGGARASVQAAEPPPPPPKTPKTPKKKKAPPPAPQQQPPPQQPPAAAPPPPAAAQKVLPPKPPPKQIPPGHFDPFAVSNPYADVVPVYSYGE